VYKLNIYYNYVLPIFGGTMRIAVCDDEKVQIDLIVAYLNSWAEKNETRVEIITFFSAEEFLFNGLSSERFDVLFLDIRMKKISGIELAKLLRKTDDKIIIVFITGLIDYVLQGYEVNALQYLLKPVKKIDILNCLDKISGLLSMRYTDTFIISLETQSIKLFYNEIIAFEIRSHYIEVYTTKGVYKYKCKISELEYDLPKNRFFRCHRSYIVNLHYVNVVTKKEAILDNGKRIPISINRWNDINNAFLKYYALGMR